MQVAVGIVQQVVIAKTTAGHHIAHKRNGEEVVLAVTAKHAARGLLGNDVTGDFHEVGFGDFALVVVGPQFVVKK